MNGLIYLLHFERPISSAHTCQHYIGWALDLNARLGMHRAGKGARLTQVAVERGIGFEVVRTWPGTRDLERQLKNRKEAPRLCPMCCLHHGWRPRPVAVVAEQLALPLDFCPNYATVDDFPTPPKLKADWLEYQIQREWRTARASYAPVGNLDDDLL